MKAVIVLLLSIVLFSGWYLIQAVGSRGESSLSEEDVAPPVKPKNKRKTTAENFVAQQLSSLGDGQTIDKQTVDGQALTSEQVEEAVEEFTEYENTLLQEQ
jgi:hypothetical protein